MVFPSLDHLWRDLNLIVIVSSACLADCIRIRVFSHLYNPRKALGFVDRATTMHVIELGGKHWCFSFCCYEAMEKVALAGDASKRDVGYVETYRRRLCAKKNPLALTGGLSLSISVARHRSAPSNYAALTVSPLMRMFSFAGSLLTR